MTFSRSDLFHLMVENTLRRVLAEHEVTQDQVPAVLALVERIAGETVDARLAAQKESTTWH